MPHQHVSHILIVDDDRDFLRMMQTILAPLKQQIYLATHAAQALELIQEKGIDVVFLDIMLPDQNGLELLNSIKQFHSDVEVVMLTALSDIKFAVEAMQRGAFHYSTKDFVADEILMILDKIGEKRRLRRELLSLRSELNDVKNKEMFMGSGEKCLHIRELIQQIADLPTTVLIQGESGTGKELLARAIHQAGNYRDKPLITVNVATLPKHLVESELFGHTRGAFTGASQQRIGKFELADGGILFLDEIGEIDPEVQVKLLRFLQEGEFERIGSNRLQRVKVRLIAATNRDLTKAVRNQLFRQDLFYRLNVVPIHLPALRERKEDIPILSALFLDRYCKRFGKQPMALTRYAEQALKAYHWPGNIRELEHLIERMVATSRRHIIDVADIPIEYTLQSLEHEPPDLSSEALAIEAAAKSAEHGFYKRATAIFERQLINRILAKTGGSKKKTAEQLGIPLSTLKFRMQKLGMVYAEENSLQTS